MFQLSSDAPLHPHGFDAIPNAMPLPPDSGRWEAPAGRMPLHRRRVRAREYVCHAGQPRRCLYLVHAGAFKVSVVSADGREKVTAFRFAGDVLGLDSLDLPVHGCDVVALDTGELWELPGTDLHDCQPEFIQWIATMLAGEVRRDWNWMLTLATLDAEQRVAAFLLDLADRMQSMGFSARGFTLRMTRADIGNFLAIKMETVTRALTRLQARDMIAVDGRQIGILDAARMRACLTAKGTHPDLPQGLSGACASSALM